MKANKLCLSQCSSLALSVPAAHMATAGEWCCVSVVLDKNSERSVAFTICSRDMAEACVAASRWM